MVNSLACATRGDAYVEPSVEGKRWLTQVWPGLGEVADAVFQARLQAALADDED